MKKILVLGMVSMVYSFQAATLYSEEGLRSLVREAVDDIIEKNVFKEGLSDSQEALWYGAINILEKHIEVEQPKKMLSKSNKVLFSDGVFRLNDLARRLFLNVAKWKGIKFRDKKRFANIQQHLKNLRDGAKKLKGKYKPKTFDFPKTKKIKKMIAHYFEELSRMANKFLYYFDESQK